MNITIGFLDTETTGLDVIKGDRIVEICLLTYDLATRQLIDTYVQRIDPDRSMSAGAQARHGISYEELVGCPKWEEVAPVVKAKMDLMQMAVAHNMAFDAPFIAHQLDIVGLPTPQIDLFCTMEHGRWACPDGKYPQLGELCFALNVPFDKSKAHGAEYDTQKLAEAFFAGLDRGFYQLPSALLVPA